MDYKNTKTKKIKVRGTATIDPATNEFGFTPFNDAPSTQSAVKTCAGGGKRWVTIGSDPSKMISLKSKESSADQYADFVSQFNALTKGMKPKKPATLPSELRVVKEERLECWLDGKTDELTFTGTISLSKHPRDWQAEVLRLVQLVVRRLPANERFNKVINQIKNGGDKK